MGNRKGNWAGGTGEQVTMRMSDLCVSKKNLDTERAQSAGGDELRDKGGPEMDKE